MGTKKGMNEWKRPLPPPFYITREPISDSLYPPPSALRPFLPFPPSNAPGRASTAFKNAPGISWGATLFPSPPPRRAGRDDPSPPPSPPFPGPDIDDSSSAGPLNYFENCAPINYETRIAGL